MPMPGDEIVPGCQIAWTRAITIDAPPDSVWPWLVQVGFGRAGFYSNDLLDNVAHPSADHIEPHLQRLHVGDWVPMFSKVDEATAFRVHSFAAPQELVWSKPDSTWAWRLTPVPPARTRLVTRIRQRYDWHSPGSALLTAMLMEFADFPMMRRMLKGIKARAEGDTPVVSPISSNARRRLYAGGRPHGLARVLNRGQAALHSAGIWPKRLATLEVRGRRSGRLRSLPVVIADLDGERYLVAMLGEGSDWVANVRAAGGRAVLRHGRREPVLLEEVPPAERAPVLRRYLEVASGARAHFPVDRKAPLSDFEAIAPRYPVFRVRGRGR